MPTDTSNLIFAENESLQKAMQELSEVKSQLAAREKQCRDLSRELELLKSQKTSESAQRLQIAAAAAQLGVFEWDEESDTASWENDRMYEIFGRTREQGPLSRSEFLAGALDPSYRPVFQADPAEAEQSGGPVHAVFRIHRCDDGRKRWVELSGQVVRPPGSSFRRLVGVIADITESKQAEETLNRQKELLESIMVATDVLLVFLDLQFNFVWVNRAYARTCGMSPEEMIGKSHFVLYPDAENEAVFRRVRDTGEAVFYKDKPFVFPDQPERGVTYWDWSLAPAKDTIGKVTGLVFSLRETTPFKVAQDKLQSSEQRYRGLFEAMSEGFALHEIICDADGSPSDYRFLEVNPAFERLTGLKRRDLIGRRVKEVLPGTEAHWIDSFGRVALTGEPLHMEEYSRDLDRWYDVIAYRTGPGHFAVVFTDSTERKRFGEALLLSEQRYRDLVQNANSAIIRWNRNGTITFFNEYAQQFFGWRAEEVIGEHVGILTPEKESTGGDLTGLVLNIVRHPERYINNINENVCRDGRRVWMTWTNRAIRDEHGEVSEILAIGSDITDRKQAEEALRQSRDDLDRAQEVGQIGSWRLDVHRNVLTWSDENYRIFGVPKGTPLAYETFLEFVHPEDRAYVDKKWKDALAEKSYDIEHRLVVGGRVKWVREKAFREFDDAGNLTGGFGITQDITERKRAEEALGASEKRYRQLFETAAEGIWQIDAEFRTVDLNERMALMLGYPREEVIGRPIHDFMAPGEMADVERRMESRRRGLSETYERLLLRKDGSTLWSLVSVTPMRDHGGKVIGSFGMLTDISERKRAEKALKKLNQTLEQQVAERTALARARTRQLQALAVQLIEAEERERRRVAQLLHDDLQQMLAAARMQLQTACESLPSEPMLASVEQLLEESMDKSRRLSHDLSPAVLHHSGLIAAIKWLGGQLQGKFGLQVRLESDSARLFEDSPLKAFLFRAVQELLFNVIKHAGVKSAHVVLSASDSNLAVAVSDRGLGFNPNLLDSQNETAGFGLMSIRERARYVGGELVIESRPKQGSRLTLTVPACLTEAYDQQRRATDREPTAPSEDPVPDGAGRIRVLIVDDHPLMREGLIKLMKARAGILVIGEAANGREAIELGRQLRPDLVLMDVSMPEMDGIEATRRLKAEQPMVRVVGLSVHEDEHLARAMREAGAEAFVCKTASFPQLLKAIYGR